MPLTLVLVALVLVTLVLVTLVLVTLVLPACFSRPPCYVVRWACKSRAPTIR